MSNSILHIETIAEGTDKIHIKVKSLIDSYSDKSVVLKSGLDHKLNVIRAARMKLYISRFLISRMKAYEAMDAYSDPRYETIKNLHHHISTSNKKWQDFMLWMISREATLIDALPKNYNASHDKIHRILRLCKELTE
jgi:hypothetical protein